MKQKLAVIFAAALLILGAASNAMACWADGDLIRVIYNRAGAVEVGTDLGSVSAIIGGSAPTGSNFSLSQVTGATRMSDLYVAYFAVAGSVSKKTGRAWLSAGSTAPTSGKKKYTAFNTGAENVKLYYSGLGASYTVIGQQGAANSYVSQMNLGGTANGSFNQFVPTGTGEMSLAALASGGFVTQTIYAWSGMGDETRAKVGTQVLATLVTSSADGQIGATSTSTPTPIPPSFLLMGSGLLGMIGIRRKFTA